MAKCVIEPGQRYYDVSRGVFGRPVNLAWIVEAVATDGLGVAHARRASVANLSVRKTLAASVLTDRTRFKKV
jgi:hypothetical protein